MYHVFTFIAAYRNKETCEIVIKEGHKMQNLRQSSLLYEKMLVDQWRILFRCASGTTLPKLAKDVRRENLKIEPRKPNILRIMSILNECLF